jgi:hypothetical protein
MKDMRCESDRFPGFVEKLRILIRYVATPTTTGGVCPQFAPKHNLAVTTKEKKQTD